MKLWMENIAPDASDGNWHDPLHCRARAFPQDARIDGMRRHLCLPLSLCGQCLGRPATDIEGYSI